ncbi:MAG: 30S ribosomal protein S4 [Candidatus Peregrinibacteria bacterium]|nr:30S ribosomal protein S4 [Candidatus Peregrinibacteria bacterium]
MRYTGPKARQCRREGVNLFGSPKYQKILSRNQNIPGMHGGKRLGKLSEYAKQLREKQKAKRIFCLSEKQFKKYFDKASSKKGITGDNLLQLLELRLDNVLFRSGIALTRMQARQFAGHGLFYFNGRKVDVPSIQVKIGDKIEIKPSKAGLKVFAHNREEAGETFDAPSWLKVDLKKLTIEVIDLPEPQHFEQIIDPQPIVEFYSR